MKPKVGAVSVAVSLTLVVLLVLPFSLLAQSSPDTTKPPTDTGHPEPDDEYLPPPDTSIVLDVSPEMIYQEAPKYPRVANQAGVTGLVWVKALVDKQRRVRQALVGKSSGTASLDSAAVRAAYGNRYKPAIVRGRPVAIWVTYKIEFMLNEGAPSFNGYVLDDTPPSLRGIPARVPADLSGTAIPTTYDPALLEKIRKLPDKEFAYPIGSIVFADSTPASERMDNGAFVWLRFKLDRDDIMREARVEYCSRPGAGYEQAALRTVRERQFWRGDVGGSRGWFWHQVFFARPRGGSLVDTLDLPGPTDFVPNESQPVLSQAGKMEPTRWGHPLIWTGRVKIRVLVGTDGNVLFAMVLKGSGDTSADEAATVAAYRSKYKPATLHNRPIPYWMAYDLDLKDKK